MPMNPEIKSQWTDALRSGDYPQAKGFLRSEGGYCCLGVLCQLAVEANVLPEPELNANGVYVYGEPGKEQETMFLPGSVQRWAELADVSDKSDPTVVTLEDRRERLAHINDYGVSFDEIADLIDVNL